MHWRTSPNNFTLELISQRQLTTTTKKQGVGKRGANPPLPRNCKRRETCKKTNATGENLWEGSMDR